MNSIGSHDSQGYEELDALTDSCFEGFAEDVTMSELFDL